MTQQDRVASYREFWPYYLRQHARAGTRAWHYLGTGLVLLCFAAALWSADPWIAVAAILAGYGPAWIGHFVVECNRPATFQYPWWSLVSDFRLFLTWLGGRLPGELAKAGIPDKRPAR